MENISNVSFIKNIEECFAFATRSPDEQIDAIATGFQSRSAKVIGSKTLAERDIIPQLVPSLVFVLNIIFSLGFVLSVFIGIGVASTPIGCASLVFLGLLLLGLWYFYYIKKPDLFDPDTRALVRSHLIGVNELGLLQKNMQTDKITFEDIYQHKLYESREVTQADSNDCSIARKYASLKFYLDTYNQLKDQKTLLEKEILRKYRAITLPHPLVKPDNTPLFLRSTHESCPSERLPGRNISIESAADIYRTDLALIQSEYKKQKKALNHLYSQVHASFFKPSTSII